MSAPRIKPFPVNRISRLARSQIDLARRCSPERWIQVVSRILGAQARRLGLGAASVGVARIESLRVEQLRHAFPGAWNFAVMCEPTTGRTGFLALDPMLVARLSACLNGSVHVLPGSFERTDGRLGAAAWLICEALRDLAEEDESWSGWRMHGLFNSAGQVGRFCATEQMLIACCLSVQVGWDSGYGVWLEAESSLNRRRSFFGPQTQVDAGLMDMPVAVVRLVGSAQLTWMETRSLRPGDVVLLDRVHPADKVRLKAGLLQMEAVVEQGRFRIARIWSIQGGFTMDDAVIKNDSEQRSDPMLDAADLPVTLAAEAGRVDLTVGQLSGLRVGDVLTLPAALLGPIDLRAGERLMARGELVDVDGRRGVRVLEIGWRGGRDDEAAA